MKLADDALPEAQVSLIFFLGGGGVGGLHLIST